MAERTDFYGSNTPKCRKSPCSFQKKSCSFHSFEPILSKRAKKKSPENPLVYWTFWRRVRDSNPRFLLGTQHFECCTFDHSDNSPCMLFRISSKNFWKELTERTTKYSIFEPEKTPDFTGFLSGANSLHYKKFRVSPVMTTSIPLRIFNSCIGGKHSVSIPLKHFIKSQVICQLLFDYLLKNIQKSRFRFHLRNCG